MHPSTDDIISTNSHHPGCRWALEKANQLDPRVSVLDEEFDEAMLEQVCKCVLTVLFKLATF